MCSCHCMLCNRDGRVFNINGVYGNQIRTIKEELVGLFGDHVHEYLKDSDVICAVCETLLNWFVKIRKLWYNRMMYHPSCRTNPKIRLQPVYYGKIWDAFSMELQKGEQMKASDLIRSPSLSSGRNSVRNSPLLIPKRENYYDPVAEKILSDTFRRQNFLSRASSSCSVDKEVEETLRKKVGRRRRRKKNGSRAKTTASTSTKRRTRSASRQSFQDWDLSSRTSPTSRTSSSSHTSPSTRRKVTRSSTRMIMEQVLQHSNEKQVELFFCDVKGCNTESRFGDLDFLTEHKVEAHKMILCYFCDECRTQYVCEADLDKHIDLKHDDCLNHCLYCGIPILSRRKLIAHHQEHSLHSVRCLYCDRAFLFKKDRDEHKRKYHRPNEKKIRNQNPRKLILNQIDYEDECSGSE